MVDQSHKEILLLLKIKEAGINLPDDTELKIYWIRSII
jgi:hypothetical protein